MSEKTNPKTAHDPLIRDYSLFRCPITGSPLEERGDALVSVTGGHRYALHDGIPDFATATVADNIKHDIQSFWNAGPCGAQHEDLKSVERGSPKFYAETEKKRYELHKDFDKPFLKDVMGFEQVTGRRVLEIGCGIGVDAIQFARGGNDMYVVDLTPNSVRLTLGRFETERLAAHAAVADAENLPFGPDSFDVVYSYGVLQHTPDTEGTIDQVYRVLKPGGSAKIMLYAKYSALALLQVGLHHGIRKGRLFKLGSFQRLLDEWTELGSKTGELPNPLSRAFTSAECRKMFRRFSSVKTEKHFLRSAHFAEVRHLLKLMPSGLRAKLPSLLGWNLVIKATK